MTRSQEKGTMRWQNPNPPWTNGSPKARRAKTLTNALQQCNTNYDYTEIAYDRDEEAWKIGFWENGAAIAAQTIMINETILHIQWAE